MRELTRRLHVLFSDQKFHALERVARAQKRSVGSLIREAVEGRYLKRRGPARRGRVGRIAKMNLPVADWKAMKEEIIAGALGKRKR